LVVPLAEKLLEVPQQLVRTALELELQDGAVVGDNAGETRSARKNRATALCYRSALEDEQLEHEGEPTIWLCGKCCSE
jgi:hypothetical protein